MPLSVLGKRCAVLSVFLWGPLTALAATPRAPSISETNLAQIQLEHWQLGMAQAQVEQLLAAHYSSSNTPKRKQVAGYTCIKQRCQAQRQSADEVANLDLYFNLQQQLYWVVLETQAQLGNSPAECLTAGTAQLAELRAKYSPDDQRHFYGPNTVTLRLNKQGHPEPSDNSFYGYRVEVKCEAYAKGVAHIEYELRDDSMLTKP